MMSPESNEELSRQLQAWQVNPPANPRFRADVWTRIQTLQAPPWTTYFRLHFPAVCSALALAFFLGGLSGRVSAREKVERESAQLATEYVRSLDARSMRMP